VVLVTTLGVISDTHGQLRPEARVQLRGVDRILHAGDLDDSSILQWLGCMAPTTAVRGNMDRGSWARALPESATVTVEGFRLHMVHDLQRIDIDPQAEGIAAVIYGHTHRPHNEVRGGVLFFNPGSAGPQRHGCPVSLGKLYLDAEGVRGEVITLHVP
jgi:uncharacterized protein